MHWWFTVLLALLSVSLQAQKADILGTVRDEGENALVSATVLLLEPSDSSLVSFSATDATGKFQFANISGESIALKITHVGYTPFFRLIRLSGKSTIDLGIIRMIEEPKQLGEVTIAAEVSPVIVRNDTVEFNAGSFRTADNAVVEELLKKLPGVEVDNDGTIRAQGKEVRRVTVDGREFFGSDPKVASRNLPADAISKVQIFDKKSDQATFTGIDDGVKEKTINLELKEEKRKGAFGQLAAGGGSEERFESKFSVNQFRKGRQLSVLGMSNNINEQGFGIEEYMNFTGGSRSMMSGRGAVRIELNSDNQNGVPLNLGNRATGLMTNYAGGINFNKDLSEKTEITSSYFYSHLDHAVNENLLRESYFPSGQIDYEEVSGTRNSNDSHRLKLAVDHKIDSMNSVKASTDFVYNEASLRTESMSEMLSRTSGTTLNSASRDLANDETTVRMNSSLLWRHRFQQKGRTFSANLSFSGSAIERDSYLDAEVSGGFTQQPFSQSSEQSIENKALSSTLTFTEPVGKRRYLEFTYSFRKNEIDFEKNTFDFLEGQPVWNDTISTAYTSVFDYHRGGINFRFNRRQIRFSAGADMQMAGLEGTLEDGRVIQRTFQNILPHAQLDWNFSDTKDFRVEYETQVREPGIQQLQPVLDNSDPLNLYVGDPSLQPEYVHQLRLNYGSFNPLTFFNFFSFIEASYTRNAISVSQSINEDGVRLTQPVNVRDSKNIMANFSVGLPIEVIKGRVALSSNIRNSTSMALTEGRENATNELSISGRARFDVQFGTYGDLGLMANVSRQSVDFDLALQQDQVYVNNTYTADLHIKFLKNYSLNSSFEFLSNKNLSNGFRQDIPLLSFSISRFLLKANAAELKLGVHNIVDRMSAVTQTSGPNYFERSMVNNLGRYVILSFIYSINKQLNPLGMRPRGRTMRIVR